MRRLCLVAAILATVLGSGSAHAQMINRTPVQLARLHMQIPPGAIIGHQTGLFCGKGEAIRYQGQEYDFPLNTYEPVFRQILTQIGYAYAGADPAGNNLFQKATAGAKILIGGALVAMDTHTCDIEGLKKTTFQVTIEWQLFSPRDQKLLARITTQGVGVAGYLDVNKTDGDLAMETFRDAVTKLARSADFIRAVRAQDDTVEEPASASDSASNAPILLPGAARQAAVKVADAVGSVVLILTGDGHGSGVLVSDDGYVLTNHHVIAGARTVKVRWSDGFETTGEVLRSNAKRDVALVKTDPHGRRALGLRPSLPEPGQTVFAIGAPLELEFQNTVTKGVVSADRTVDGLSFIQSDVTVNHGNSGGPLLNEQGQVIGLTDLGYAPDGVPTGINLFIPIKDALDFLSLQPR